MDEKVREERIKNGCQRQGETDGERMWELEKFKDTKRLSELGRGKK